MYGIISDVHGNLVGLEKIIAHGGDLGVREWWSLGDVVGYGPYPVECLLRVMDLCDISLLGNHETAVSEKIVAIKNGTDFNISLLLQGRGALQGGLWTIRQFLGDSTPIQEGLTVFSDRSEALAYTTDLLRRAYSDDDRVKKNLRGYFGRLPIRPSSLLKREWILKIREFYANNPMRSVCEYLFDYITNLEPKVECETSFGNGLLVHDQPENPGVGGYIRNELNPVSSSGEPILSYFEKWSKLWPDIRFICAGHSHVPGIFHDKGRYIVMPGSAMVKKGPRLISYVTFDPDNKRRPFVLHYLKMDHAVLDAEMNARGIPSVYKGVR